MINGGTINDFTINDTTGTAGIRANADLVLDRTLTSTGSLLITGAGTVILTHTLASTGQATKVAIDSFVPLVMPYVPLAPEPLIVRQVRDAASRFCQRTRLWREETDIVTDGTPAFIVPPSEANVLVVLACAIDGHNLDPITLTDLARLNPNWRNDPATQGCGRWFVSPAANYVQAVPPSSGTLHVEYALIPNIGAESLPSFLLDTYWQDIVNGAVGKLLMMPRVPWADPATGSAMMQQFEARLGALSDIGAKGQHRAPIRTKASFM